MSPNPRLSNKPYVGLLLLALGSFLLLQPADLSGGSCYRSAMANCHPDIQNLGCRPIHDVDCAGAVSSCSGQSIATGQRQYASVRLSASGKTGWETGDPIRCPNVVSCVLLGLERVTCADGSTPMRFTSCDSGASVEVFGYDQITAHPAGSSCRY
jgi:hypothetical protein